MIKEKQTDRRHILETKQLVERERLYKMIQKDMNKKRLLYWRANTGWGKTITMLQYFSYAQISYDYFKGDDDNLLGELQESIQTGVQHILIDDLQKMNVDYWEALIKYIQEASPDIKFYFLSRAWLPAYLKKYEITNEMQYYSTEHLAFNVSEAEALLNLHGIACNSQLLKQVVQQTNGWLVCIIFMSRRARNAPLLKKKHIDLAKVDLFDFLDHNIMNMWSPEMKTFLLNIGHLESFNEKEACIVCGKASVSDILKQIMTSASFLVQDDECTYHFQRPMDVYLNQKQKDTYDEAAIRQRYENTALYFLMENDIPNALKYYSMAGDKQKITEILIENANALQGDAYYFELEKYYMDLDYETVEASPEMMTAMAMLHSMFMRVEESNSYVKRLEAFERKLPVNDIRKKAARRKLDFLQLALPHYGSQSVIQKLLYLAKCKQELQKTSVTGDMPSMMSGGLDFCEWSLKDRQLYKTMRTTINFVLGKSNSGVAEIALGESLFEKNSDGNYTECLMLINSGKTSSEIAGNLQMQFAANALIARIFLAQGRVVSARNIMESFHEKVTDSRKRQLPLNTAAFLVWLDLLNGEEPDTWLTSQSPNENEHFFILERYCYLMKIRAYIQKEMYLEAISLLERVEQYFELYERKYNIMETKLLRSIVFFRMENELWEKELDEALQLTFQYRFIRVVSDLGTAVLKPLEQYRENCQKPKDEIQQNYLKYLEDLIVNTGKQACWYPKYMVPKRKQNYALTESEMRILTLLVHGMTNQEMAQKLVISLSTVKSHLSNIYEKLHVKNRTSAMQLALEKGLCEPE